MPDVKPKPSWLPCTHSERHDIYGLGWRCELECNAELVEYLSCEDDEVMEEVKA